MCVYVCAVQAYILVDISVFIYIYLLIVCANIYFVYQSIYIYISQYQKIIFLITNPDVNNS